MTCKFKTKLTIEGNEEEYECLRDADERRDYCIFHCDKEKFTEEEIKEFKNKFWKEFERQENDHMKRKAPPLNK